MLLNKLPCLDKGYVAYVDSENNSTMLKALALEFYKSSDGTILDDLSSLTLVIKCPLFVQLNLSTFNLKIFSTPPGQELEAYIPNVGEVGAPDHTTSKAISDDMYRTTEALLINPRAYQADGCDKFISQVMSPINIYTTLIVKGTHAEWRKFVNQPKLPVSIQAYTKAVSQILTAEWRRV